MVSDEKICPLYLLMIVIPLPYQKQRIFVFGIVISFTLPEFYFGKVFSYSILAKILVKTYNNGQRMFFIFQWKEYLF
nr:MAG TPA: hypothetical protein [Caudoviricetes sp.]